MSPSPEIIAHSIPTLREAKISLESGIQTAEVDVAQAITGRFIIQHQGLLGKIGLGENLANFLKERNNNLLLDLKHPQYSPNFAKKLSGLLMRMGVVESKVCGTHWKTVSSICENVHLSPYYTINSENHFRGFSRTHHQYLPAEGFSVHHSLITEQFMRDLGKGTKILAWDVNDRKTATRMHQLGVTAIITRSEISPIL